MGARRSLEKRAIFGKGRLLRVDDPVDHFDADERVFIGGVAMEKFMLHQAGQGPEFGEKAAEKTKLVHRAQGAAHLSLAGEDGEKRVAHPPSGK